MGLPDSERLLLDLIKRTKSNLAAIEELAAHKPAEVFEVTQLLNSMMSLIVLPFELDKQFELSAEDTKFFESMNLIPNKNLSSSEVIGAIRHALSHGNVAFKGGLEIEVICLWNVPPQRNREGVPNFIAELSIENLKSVANRIESISETAIMTENRIERYKEIIRKAGLT